MKLLLSLLQTSRSSNLDDHGKTIFFLATKNQTTIRQLLHSPAANLPADLQLYIWMENAPLNIVYAQ